MLILCPHAAWFHERRISNVTFTLAYLYSNIYMQVGMALALADSSNFGLLVKFTKMGDSQSWMPINSSEKFDAASFILGGEIRNCTHKQTANNISTPCLSACVDNKVCIIAAVIVHTDDNVLRKKTAFPCWRAMDRCWIDMLSYYHLSAVW